MPLRCWLYAARVYEKILDGKNIYRDRLIKIPKPEIYVCYSGEKPLEDKDRVLKLSDAFMTDGAAGEHEFTVKVFDVNKKHDGEILSKSRILDEYAEFIEAVREKKQAGADLSEAMTGAIKECIKKGVLKEFLERHGSEVRNMLFVEFDIDVAKEVWREEAIEEGMEIGIKKGIEKGIEKGKLEVAKNLLKMGENIEKVVKALELPIEKVQEIKYKMENQ